jgi:hypothetical protein
MRGMRTGMLFFCRKWVFDAEPLCLNSLNVEVKIETLTTYRVALSSNGPSFIIWGKVGHFPKFSLE